MSLPIGSGQRKIRLYVSQKLTAKYALLLVLTSLLFIKSFAQPPVTTSFSPASGPVGTSVTISGSNFSPTASANTVYFGVVKAGVTSASTTSLTVTVPAGATYQLITVTKGSLTASANGSFAITFPSNPLGITANSFAAKTDFVSGYNPRNIVAVDLDGDGEVDMVTANQNAGTFSVFRNTGSSGTISFAARTDFLNEQYFSGVAICDFDNDGKPDIAVAYSNDYKFSILRNTSGNGIISFAPKVDVTTTGTSYSLDVADLNGDGKDDIAITNYI